MVIWFGRKSRDPRALRTVSLSPRSTLKITWHPGRLSYKQYRKFGHDRLDSWALSTSIWSWILWPITIGIVVGLLLPTKEQSNFVSHGTSIGKRGYDIAVKNIEQQVTESKESAIKGFIPTPRPRPTSTPVVRK